MLHRKPSYFSIYLQSQIDNDINHNEESAVIFATGVQQPRAQEMADGEVVHLCPPWKRTKARLILYVLFLHHGNYTSQWIMGCLGKYICETDLGLLSHAANGPKPMYSRSTKDDSPLKYCHECSVGKRITVGSSFTDHAVICALSGG